MTCAICRKRKRSEVFSTNEVDEVVIHADGHHFSHTFTQDNPGRIDDFYLIGQNKLGKGAFGTVVRATHRATGADRAIKSISLQSFQRGDMVRFQNEVNIQKSLDHPNIVKLYETFKDAKCVYLAMEVCAGGELFDRIVEHQHGFTEQKAATYMKQIISALYYLHRHNIAHRDLKPENFLLQNRTPNAEIKVIDFGLAAKFHRDAARRVIPMQTKAGTPYYVAPEVLAGSYDHKCDIWSSGVICYILLCGCPPFSGADDNALLLAVKKGEYSFPSPEFDHVSHDAKALIGLMLAKNPGARPDAEELLHHAWLQKKAAKGHEVVRPQILQRLQAFNKARKLKKICLTLIATQLKEKDVEDLRLQFKAFDKNGDGTISKKELLAGIQSKAHHCTLSQKEIDQLMELDSDGSGEIDYTEFIAASIERRLYEKREIAWGAFRTFDLNGDGKITKDELRQVMATGVDTSLTDEQLHALIKDADKDGDGCIDFEEFMAMLLG